MSITIQNVDRCTAFIVLIASLKLLHNSIIFSGQILQDELVFAFDSGNLNTVINCLRRGANPNHEYGGGWTLLGSSVFHDRWNAFEIMLQFGADVNRKAVEWTPLGWAARKGRKKMLERLLQLGADVNHESENVTPLCWAAYGGHHEVLKVLLRAGSDLDDKCRKGTALECAAKGNYQNIVKELLQHGAQLPSDYQSNALLQKHSHLAREWSWYVEKALLVEQSALPNELAILIRKMATNAKPKTPALS